MRYWLSHLCTISCFGPTRPRRQGWLWWWWWRPAARPPGQSQESLWQCSGSVNVLTEKAVLVPGGCDPQRVVDLVLDEGGEQPYDEVPLPVLLPRQGPRQAGGAEQRNHQTHGQHLCTKQFNHDYTTLQRSLQLSPKMPPQLTQLHPESKMQ